MSISRNGGKTWRPREMPIHTAGNTARSGCWEPAAIQMPNGNLWLLFARELPGEQEIALMTSPDAGLTWTAARRASLRPGHRDGMPVPLLLADGSSVFAIEDNGVVSGRPEHRSFRPTIVDPDSSQRWNALAQPPRADCNLAAPYLARLPSGETLLSVQSNEDDPRWTQMVVYVGDHDARNFGSRSRPFGSSSNANGRWNSLHVLDQHRVIAISHTTVDQCRGLWCIEGRVLEGIPCGADPDEG
jgi:hypothetical protein